MTGLGAGDAGPTGDLQVQVDEPEPDSLTSQVGHPQQPPPRFFLTLYHCASATMRHWTQEVADKQSNLKDVSLLVIKLEFTLED